MDIKFLPDLVDGLATAQCLKRKTAAWRLTNKKEQFWPRCLKSKHILSIWAQLLWLMESVKCGYANATNLLVQPLCV